MRLANHDGRAAIVLGDEIADVATASDGNFGPDLGTVYDRWREFNEFAATVTMSTGPLERSLLGCPSPSPSQVFAIGLNYRSHSDETGRPPGEVPATFTKFATALSGPFDDIVIPNGTIDWEVELVVVIGTEARHVPAHDAWSHVAGLTIGQDISDRQLQFAAGSQFSLGKSRPGFAPMGPWLVTPDEFADPDDLGLGCSLDGEVLQDARTADLIVDVPALIAELSSILPLLPGDVIFTGTPGGVGFARTPQRFLAPGHVLETWIEGIGSMRNRCVAPA